MRLLCNHRLIFQICHFKIYLPALWRPWFAPPLPLHWRDHPDWVRTPFLQSWSQTGRTSGASLGGWPRCSRLSGWWQPPRWTGSWEWFGSESWNISSCFNLRSLVPVPLLFLKISNPWYPTHGEEKKLTLRFEPRFGWLERFMWPTGQDSWARLVKWASKRLQNLEY